MCSVNVCEERTFLCGCNVCAKDYCLHVHSENETPYIDEYSKTFQKCNIKLQVFERVVTLFCNILYFLMSSIVVLYNERYMHLFILLVQ